MLGEFYSRMIGILASLWRSLGSPRIAGDQKAVDKCEYILDILEDFYGILGYISLTYGIFGYLYVAKEDGSPNFQQCTKGGVCQGQLIALELVWDLILCSHSSEELNFHEIRRIPRSVAGGMLFFLAFEPIRCFFVYSSDSCRSSCRIYGESSITWLGQRSADALTPSV